MQIGAIFCSCAEQITEKINFEKFSKLIIKHLAWLEKFDLACSEENIKKIIRLLKDRKPDGLVILACTPKNKESVFRNLAIKSGLNPYMINIVNIREQVAWVTEDKDEALNKAYKLFKAELNRLKKQKPLQNLDFSVCSDIVVVGAGITGIKSALVLSKAKRKVYLVEKEKFLGGKVVKYDKLFPDLTCGPCMVHPMIEDLINSKNIEIKTNTEIKEIKGFYGNFHIKTISKPTYVDLTKCIGCSACEEACPEKAIKVNYLVLPVVADIDAQKCIRLNGYECDKCIKECPIPGAINFSSSIKQENLKAGAVIWATGFRLFDCSLIPELGYGKFKDVYNSLEFEEILNSEGPTKGEIQTEEGHYPEKIAIIHCVGSLEEEYYPYCSKICCQYAFKFNRILRQNFPEIELTHFVKEIVLPGKKAYKLYYQSVRDPLVKIYRYKSLKDLNIEKHSCMIVSLNGKEFPFDIVVLCPAIICEDSTESVHGIYLTGSVREPMTIDESINDALSVAGEILSTLQTDSKISKEPVIAKIDYNKCNRCGICISLCPLKAIEIVNDSPKILDILCEGCGICVSSCPSKAIELEGYTYEEIIAELDGIMSE